MARESARTANMTSKAVQPDASSLSMVWWHGAVAVTQLAQPGVTSGETKSAEGSLPLCWRRGAAAIRQRARLSVTSDAADPAASSSSSLCR
jgi:hypothetical protein